MDMAKVKQIAKAEESQKEISTSKKSETSSMRKRRMYHPIPKFKGGCKNC